MKEKISCFSLQVQACLNELPSSDAYLLENQSHRKYVHSKGFLEIGVQLRALEAMLYAVLKNVKKAPVLSILPMMTSQYFNTQASTTAAKKKASVELVEELIHPNFWRMTPMGNHVHVPDDLFNYFKDQRKKDDLSDCLLQAVAFMEWSQMARTVAGVERQAVLHL